MTYLSICRIICRAPCRSLGAPGTYIVASKFHYSRTDPQSPSPLKKKLIPRGAPKDCKPTLEPPLTDLELKTLKEMLTIGISLGARNAQCLTRYNFFSTDGAAVSIVAQTTGTKNVYYGRSRCRDCHMRGGVFAGIAKFLLASRLLLHRYQAGKPK